MNQTHAIEQAAINFKSGLRGDLIEPGDAKYESARKVYNGMIDKRPRYIARCADVADVISAVNFARESKLVIAIRGGSHNAGGLGVWDDALVIDLSPINYTHVDPVSEPCGWAAAAPGARWITPRTPSAWRSRPESFPPPAWAD